MRPSLLNPLFASAASLPGVGPKNAALFDRLLAGASGQARAIDLLFHLPHSSIDRSKQLKIAEAPLDQVLTIEAKVVDHRPPAPRSKSPYRVVVEDETGDVELVFFLANHQWIARSLPQGATRWISGKLELWDGHRQMVHPDRVLDAESFARMPLIEPVYGLTEGLYPRVLAKAIEAAVQRLPALPEWHTNKVAKIPHLPSFAAALTALHHPQETSVLESLSPPRIRLAFDEFLAHQLALILVRAQMRRASGRANCGDGRIADTITRALPFALTRAQNDAIAEIRADLAAPRRMLRLLQGDVGSGKTIVALIAMAHVVEAGRQSALMTPTEILARQHFEAIARHAGDLRIALMTGRDKAAERERTLADLSSGEIDIIVGTHALFQESVQFHNLGLAVVDEQHKFGVHQRLALGGKGEDVDVLVMTATPIPRTLVLTYFGDMDVSSLREKPPGRQPIETRALPLDRLGDVLARLQSALAAGTRVYWVCPLVEESEELDVAAAQERYEALRALFGDKVGLVHGKLKGRDKDLAMSAFIAGETRILVATTVIEVGVDVPDATIIVIEHAERFGLAQLHQLRGRVGRGRAKSSCLLLYKAPLGANARARLEIMRETEDGFRIAEEDLRLRGEGEVLGTRQSGAPGFRLARLPDHAELLQWARAEAQEIVARNPRLVGAEGEALRILLYLFERDAAVKLLQAG